MATQDQMTCEQCLTILERPYGKTFCSAGCIYAYENGPGWEMTPVRWHDYRFWPAGTNRPLANLIVKAALLEVPKPRWLPRCVWTWFQQRLREGIMKIDA